MLGSANISGSKALHIMSGNLSHQIEHHLFPDLPSNRYGEIAPRVQEICERYGLTYTTGPLYKQVASAWGQVIALSLPNAEPGRNRVGIAAEQIGKQVRRKLRNRRPARTA
jgi:linoleoyl-CoA desaturase